MLKNLKSAVSLKHETKSLTLALVSHLQQGDNNTVWLFLSMGFLGSNSCYIQLDLLMSRHA